MITSSLSNAGRRLAHFLGFTNGREGWGSGSDSFASVKRSLVSLVVVENASLLWFNAIVLRLNAPLVLFVFEMKGWFRRNLIGEQAINYAIYY